MPNPDMALMEKLGERLQRQTARTPIDGGGSGGDDGGMETRIKALEDANLETRDRLARIETTLQHVATKADLHAEIRDQTWKLIGWTTTIAIALIGATSGIIKLMAH